MAEMNSTMQRKTGRRKREPVETRQSELARLRAALYSLAAQALSVPREALCAAVDQGAVSKILRVLLAGLPVSYTRGMNQDIPEKLVSGVPEGAFAESILTEYTRLFGLNLQCPQYEGDYLARNSYNSVFVIADVSSMYSAFGVQLAGHATERPDHIAVELDFMALLAGKEAHARQMRQIENVRLCRRAQRVFLRSHLSCWAGAFACNLREETRLEFYRGVGDFLETLVAVETRYLKIQPEAPVNGEAAVEAAGGLMPAVTAPQPGACSSCMPGSGKKQNLVSLPGGVQESNPALASPFKIL
jgi:DMSO reductase family type II enzyme chaperone